jgi:hypothetical protein
MRSRILVLGGAVLSGVHAGERVVVGGATPLKGQ